MVRMRPSLRSSYALSRRLARCVSRGSDSATRLQGACSVASAVGAGGTYAAWSLRGLRPSASGRAQGAAAPYRRTCPLLPGGSGGAGASPPRTRRARPREGGRLRPPQRTGVRSRTLARSAMCVGLALGPRATGCCCVTLATEPLTPCACSRHCPLCRREPGAARGAWRRRLSRRLVARRGEIRRHWRSLGGSLRSSQEST